MSGYETIPIDKRGMLKPSRKRNWRPGMRKIDQHSAQLLRKQNEQQRQALYILKENQDRITEHMNTRIRKVHENFDSLINHFDLNVEYRQ